ncbi:MAG: SCP2 sterol-binding domain-containing protein [Anaerolineae bacterium]|jgi:putative sterol carrier protein
MAFTSVSEILEGISKIDAEQVKGVNGVMLFDATGEGGGQWTLTLADDGVKLEEGETTTPDVTFTMDAQDFVAIANGELNAISAFMQGKVKVTGNMALAMRLQSLLG